MGASPSTAPHTAAPDPRRRAQPAEPGGAGVQHVGRIHGQLCRGAPEQHREQVERIARAPVAASGRSAGREQRPQPAPRPAATRRSPAPDAQPPSPRPARAARRRSRTRSSRREIHEAAERRTCDGRHLPGRGVSATAVAEVRRALASQVGQQRLPGRPGEGARDAEHAPSRRHRPRRIGARRAANASSSRAQTATRARSRPLGCGAVVAVRTCRPAAPAARRQELRQADEPEVQRIARHLVDLPADRDGLHLHRERREEAARD